LGVRPLSSSTPWKIKETWTIRDFQKERSKIQPGLQPIFQRGNVWRPNKQRLLIDSIMRGWEIGRILLNATGQPCGKGKFKLIYQVVDGQQRIRAIYKFLDGELAIPERGPDTVGIYKISGEQYDLRGKRFTDKDFPEEARREFFASTIPVKVYMSKSDGEIARIFVRVQEGLPLSSPEKLNAVLGYIRDEITKVSEHELLKKTKIRETRFNRRWVVAHIVFHEIEDFVGKGFRRAHMPALRKMYESHREKSPEAEKALRKVKKTLDYLNAKLDKQAALLEKNPDFITLCMLCSYLQQKGYVIDGISGLDWGDFIEEFLLKVAEAKDAFKKLPSGESLPADLEPYHRYETSRRREGREEIKERFEIMIEKFLERFPAIPRKDEQRLFDEYQRRLIFNRCK